ncbi:MAG: SH3 domain-containing protein [Syntrophaceae bacterium]|nr:SH3 domain-containing protein [Syntrophaceae bacterium]
MKKKKMIISAVTSAACILLFIALAHAAATMSIQVRETQIRATPDYFGKIIGKASYGDQVIIEGTKGSWKKVRLQKTGRTGWLNSSALSAKEIKIVAGAKGTKGTASASELQLAGKGFNPEVEKEFKNRNKEISFHWVDKMEQIRIPETEKQKFAREGGLAINGNGGRQ